MGIELWIATGNSHKLSEYKTLLHNQLTTLDWKLRSPKDLTGVFTSPPETGKTYEDNARIKARALRSVRNQDWVVGEDSGLEVEGLGALPGVHSARYAGPKASDQENVAKLLKMMALKPMPNRNARFVCTLVVFSAQGTEHVMTGELKGTIAKAQRGLQGFGYDPVFVPDGQVLGSEQTLAEMTPGEKNKISHRALAVKQLLALIAAQT